MPERRFVWLTHTPPSTRWLKRELSVRAPNLRFAFARPGLTTFKASGDELPQNWKLPSSFARAWGFSLGRASSVAEVLALADTLSPAPMRLHVFERPIERSEGEPLTTRNDRASALRSALLEAAPDRWLPDPRANKGDLVLDVIAAPAHESEEPYLIGWHHHSPAHGREPGGVEHVPPPAEAPSRAWSKIEEALRWTGLEPRAGELAIEIGAAPGGASFALLERGVSVIGIDPGPIAAQVLAHRSGFTHLRRPFADVERRELPRRFDYLLLDVNLAPTIALRYVEKLSRMITAPPRAAVLTLKLNDDAVADSLPRLHDKLRELAGQRGRVRVTQLPSHRSEVVAIIDWPRAAKPRR